MIERDGFDKLLDRGADVSLIPIGVEGGHFGDYLFEQVLDLGKPGFGLFGYMFWERGLDFPEAITVISFYLDRLEYAEKCTVEARRFYPYISASIIKEVKRQRRTSSY